MNMRGSYYRRVIKAKNKKAGSDRRRSFIPMVDCGRQERAPGAFLLLTRYRTGLKPGGQLPSGLYYPIVVCFNSSFNNKKTAGFVQSCTLMQILIILVLRKSGSGLSQKVAGIEIGSEIRTGRDFFIINQRISGVMLSYP